MAKAKRYVFDGKKYSAKSNSEVAADLVNQGFAPGLSAQLAAEHEKIATSGARKLMKPEKQPKIPTTMEWELPDSKSRI